MNIGRFHPYSRPIVRSTVLGRRLKVDGFYGALPLLTSVALALMAAILLLVLGISLAGVTRQGTAPQQSAVPRARYRRVSSLLRVPDREPELAVTRGMCATALIDRAVPPSAPVADDTCCEQCDWSG